MEPPDNNTGHGRHQEMASNGLATLLLPVFRFLAMTFQQLIKAFNSPSPVIPQGHLSGIRLVCWDIGEQGPGGSDLTGLIHNPAHHQSPWDWGACNRTLLSICLSFVLATQDNIHLCHLLNGGFSVVLNRPISVKKTF